MTLPNKETLRINLRDDGKSGDGAPKDGIFAAAVPFTMPGSYLATVEANLTPGDEKPFTILKTSGHFSYEATDRDADGIPDDWETRYSECEGGLNPRGDPDSDGLDNAAELHIGTHPFNADTDGDGRSDSEEASAGLDPLRSDQGAR